MEKQSKVSKQKAKTISPEAKARYQMIKEAAMKFASQRKAKMPIVKKVSLAPVAKKKKPKGRIGIPLRKDRQARRDAAAAALTI